MNYLCCDEGIQILVDLLLQEKLTPFFGSGFSKNGKTKTAFVPDGDKCIELMSAEISKTGLDISALHEFDEVSRRFFSQLTLEQRNHFFTNYFTGVKLPPHLKEFLQLPWQYAYTINIDDGIEENSNFYPIHPYFEFSNNKTSIKRLYKLHGDAKHEITYTNDSIVFMSDQYINSLTSEDNRTMRNSLAGDYLEKNLVFIGCSLKKEVDLLFFYNKHKHNIPPNLLRAIIKDKQPSTNEELNLEDYGINTVILVDDFNCFYGEFTKKCNAVENEITVNHFPFYNPIIEKKSNKSGQKQALNIFTGVTPFVENENKFLWSDLIVLRDKVSVIENEISKNCFMLLKGRRFSGRTSLLMMLISRLNRYHIYYFPSTSLQDELVIVSLLKKKKNALFLFDSNSLNDNTYYCVSNASADLKVNNNRVVVVVNSNDTFMLEKTSAKVAIIENKFTFEELKKLNTVADSYGLQKRNRTSTNIDYLQLLESEQKIETYALGKLPAKLSKNEQILLVLLAIKQKIFFSDAFALDIYQKELELFCIRMNNIVEIVPVSRGESSSHSGKKLVHNSQYVLLAQISRLARKEIIFAITSIVRAYKNDKTRRRIAVDVILFDNLNQIFGNKGVYGNFINELYDALAELLNSDLDYWLQRAKNIYRNYATDYTKLQTAYSYAKKVYSDSNNENNMRGAAKAALAISHICCLLNELSKPEPDTSNHVIEAIDFAFIAMGSEFYQKYSDHIKNPSTKDGRKKYNFLIYNLCKSNIDIIGELPPETLYKAKIILQRLDVLDF